MYASHYVIGDILEKWNNLDEVKEEFGKFAERYSQDEEFQKIYTKFKQQVKDNPGELRKIKKELEDLEKVRHVDSSGGTKDLPYADRRRHLG